MPVVSLLLLLYPLLVRLAMSTDNAWAAAGAIFFLAVLIFLPLGLSGKHWAWPLLLVLGMAAAALAVYGGTEIMLYLPPVIIPLALAWFFGRTLLPGSRALISRISEALRKEPLPTEVARYTRRVTWFWVIYFLCFSAEAAILPWFVSQETWWLFTHVLNWVLVPTALTIEYLYHSRVYPNKVHHSIGDFLRDLARVDYKKLLAD